MSIVDKGSAQQRSDQIHAFTNELAELERDHVFSLTAEQRQSIHDYHQNLFNQYRNGFDIDSTQQEKQLSMGMRIASFFGAVALAASLFFLVYQFWGRFATVGQVAILGTVSIVSFIATHVVASKDDSGYFTKLVGLVAFAGFVLNIAMFG